MNTSGEFPAYTCADSNADLDPIGMGSVWVNTVAHHDSGLRVVDAPDMTWTDERRRARRDRRSYVRMRRRVFSKRERPTADRLNCDESLVGPRVDNGRDELEATGRLLRSISDVITMESFMVMMLNTGSPSTPVKEAVPAALATNRRT